MAYPQEFGKDLTQDVLSSIIDPITEFGRQDEGRALMEGTERGLGGQAMQGSLLGAARGKTASSKSAAIADFNYRLAGMGREDRQRGEGRGWQVEDRNFAAAEAQKDRDQREKLQLMGYAASDAAAKRDKITGQQGMVAGGLMKIGTNLAGSAASSYFSDERLKKNIVPVGKHGDLTIYEFDYRDDMGIELPAGRQRGYMAQEVEKIMPAAVSFDRGFRRVDYAMVGGL